MNHGDVENTNLDKKRDKTVYFEIQNLAFSVFSTP